MLKCGDIILSINENVQPRQRMKSVSLPYDSTKEHVTCSLLKIYWPTWMV